MQSLPPQGRHITHSRGSRGKCPAAGTAVPRSESNRFSATAGRNRRYWLHCLGFSAGCLRRVRKRNLCSRQRCKSEKLEDLCAWLKQIGVQGVDGLRLGASTKVNGGLAAFATKDFAPGEVVCFVPEQGILAGVRQQGLPKEACLARALLREKELKSESFFAPYINCLPTAQELPSIHPYFWPPELEMENLMAGSVHGQRVAKEILAEGRRRESLNHILLNLRSPNHCCASPHTHTP